MSCSSKKQENLEILVPESSATDSIQMLYACDSLKITVPLGTCAWGSSDTTIWIINDSHIGAIFNLFSRLTGEKIDEYGHYGQGPAEFITMNPGSCFDECNAMAYDIMNGKLIINEMTEDIIQTKYTYKLPYDEQGFTYPYTYISQLNDSVFLMKYDSDIESGWHIYDLKNAIKYSHYQNQTRNPDQSYTPFDYIQVVSDSTIVIAYRYINLVEIYSVDLLSYDIAIKKRYGNLNTQENLKDYNDLQYTYLSVTVSNGTAFCLVSSSGSEDGATVLCFDLNEMKPTKKLILSNKVNSILIDNDKNLLGLHENQNDISIYCFGSPFIS